MVARSDATNPRVPQKAATGRRFEAVASSLVRLDVQILPRSTLLEGVPYGFLATEKKIGRT